MSSCDCKGTEKCTASCVRNRCEMIPPFVERVCNCIQVVEREDSTGARVSALRISLTTTVYNCNKQKCLKHVSILDDLGSLTQGLGFGQVTEQPCQSCASEFCVLGEREGLTSVPATFTDNYPNCCLDKDQSGKLIARERPVFNSDYLKGVSSLVFTPNTGIGGNGIPLETGELLQWTEMVTVPCCAIELCTSVVVAGEGFCPVIKSTTLSLAGLCRANEQSDCVVPPPDVIVPPN